MRNKIKSEMSLFLNSALAVSANYQIRVTYIIHWIIQYYRSISLQLLDRFLYIFRFVLYGFVSLSI